MAVAKPHLGHDQDPYGAGTERGHWRGRSEPLRGLGEPARARGPRALLGDWEGANSQLGQGLIAVSEG